MGREHLEVYHSQDEAVPRISRLAHDPLVHTPDLYTEEEWKTSPTYNEFLARSGTRYSLYATIGLTPSEDRMAALMTEGLMVSEIAAAQGWRENYVRWLVQQVYRKPDVSGHVALVRRVLVANALPQR